MLITSHNQKVSIKQKPNAWYVSRFVILSKKKYGFVYTKCSSVAKVSPMSSAGGKPFFQRQEKFLFLLDGQTRQEKTILTAGQFA